MVAEFAWLFCGDPAGIRTPDTLLKRQVLCRLSYWVKWLGWPDSNQRMRESKSRALPLGYTPSSRGILYEKRAGTAAPALSREISGVGKGTRTLDTRNHNPVL